MILFEKGIPDTTIMKLVSKLLRRSNLPKGFKIKTLSGVQTITSEELIGFVDSLAEGLEKGDYGVIRRCDTCGNYGHPGRKNKRGLCPSHEGSFLKYPTDFCSSWKPMTKEQQKMKERIDEVFKIQNERSRNAPKSSKKRNRPAD